MSLFSKHKFVAATYILILEATVLSWSFRLQHLTYTNLLLSSQSCTLNLNCTTVILRRQDINIYAKSDNTFQTRRE